MHLSNSYAMFSKSKILTEQAKKAAKSVAFFYPKSVNFGKSSFQKQQLITKPAFEFSSKPSNSEQSVILIDGFLQKDFIMKIITKTEKKIEGEITHVTIDIFSPIVLEKGMAFNEENRFAYVDYYIKKNKISKEPYGEIGWVKIVNDIYKNRGLGGALKNILEKAMNQDQDIPVGSEIISYIINPAALKIALKAEYGYKIKRITGQMPQKDMDILLSKWEKDILVEIPFKNKSQQEIAEIDERAARDVSFLNTLFPGVVLVARIKK